MAFDTATSISKAFFKASVEVTQEAGVVSGI